jgi:CrcB protein
MTTTAGPAVPDAPVGTMAPTRAAVTPDYRSWSAVLMVFLGGALGTVARESLDLVTPAEHLVYTTFLINVVGSCALAAVYTALLVRNETAILQRRIRLFVGTGFMGGFTTYGSFAVATAAAAARHSVGDSALYAAGSIVLGVVAALFGRWAVESIHRRRSSALGSGSR